MTRLEIEAFLMIVKMGSISQAAQKLENSWETRALRTLLLQIPAAAPRQDS